MQRTRNVRREWRMKSFSSGNAVVFATSLTMMLLPESRLLRKRMQACRRRVCSWKTQQKCYRHSRVLVSLKCRSSCACLVVFMLSLVRFSSLDRALPVEQRARPHGSFCWITASVWPRRAGVLRTSCEPTPRGVCAWLCCSPRCAWIAHRVSVMRFQDYKVDMRCDKCKCHLRYVLPSMWLLLRAQIKREVAGGSHPVFEAFLHGRQNSECHKALKMLRLSQLRQLQREVGVCLYTQTHEEWCEQSYVTYDTVRHHAGDDPKSRAPLLHPPCRSGVCR